MRGNRKVKASTRRPDGLGASIKAREHYGWITHPITQNDYEWLKRTVKGWTAKKFAYHGMHYPPPKGWRKRIIKDFERAMMNMDFERAMEVPAIKKTNNLPSWHYAPPTDATIEMESMKKLYQEKSGDYSY